MVSHSQARVLTTSPTRAAYGRALDHLRTRQHADGRVAGEVVWNIMLPCQYVMLAHILGRPIAPRRRAQIIVGLRRQQNEDGGWGMHPHTPSFLFHTVLGYVALRLLDCERTDPMLAAAHRYIDDQGGAYEVPAWGRAWLALLGLYPWEGMQPIVPELWLLPKAAPLHPSRLYCHMRLIYLGLSFLYGTRFVCPDSPVLAEIRREIFPKGSDARTFAPYRDRVAKTDLYEPVSGSLKSVFSAVRTAERFVPKAVRRRALDVALEHILYEFRSTNYVCLSPVNGMLFCIALHATDPDHPELDRAFAGIEYWVWADDHEGFRIAGARSDIWDTAFLVQALCEGPAQPQAEEIVRRACRWLPTAQIKEELVGGARHFRSPAYGGWGFANEDHPWPVSDCTAEALEALMRAEARGFSDSAGRLTLGSKLAAIEFVLRRRNDDGGFGSYEARRGSMVLRRYNPAELYGNCMLEYSYAECTGTCVRSLAYASAELGDDLPTALAERVREAVDGGADALLASQRQGGGWLGFWGINITYGTFFAAAGVHAAGHATTHPSLRGAVQWLLDNQRPDGGWAEGHEGLLSESAAPLPADEPSLVSQTAWAMLTLLEVAPQHRAAIDRALAFLLGRQQADGAWMNERATGVFFNTAVLDYRLYRHIFPTWAIARYLRTYGEDA